MTAKATVRMRFLIFDFGGRLISITTSAFRSQKFDTGPRLLLLFEEPHSDLRAVISVKRA
jgi:hypothetical protein